MKRIKEIAYKVIFGGSLGRKLSNCNFESKYPNAANYWEKRYQRNGTSGNGSYGVLANHKATILNQFVIENDIKRVIEFGCGDGNQLKLFLFPEYVGLDVSSTAIEKCKNIFRDDLSKAFFIYNHDEFAGNPYFVKADCALSLDVVYHLLEDDVFENYMCDLFASSTRFVIIYAWDVEGKKNQHVRHRKFTEWIERNIKEWKIVSKIENKELPSACDFFIYERE